MEMYLILYEYKSKRTWKKTFKCEYDMDKFIEKLKYVPNVSIIEDSRAIYYPDYNI